MKTSEKQQYKKQCKTDLKRLWPKVEDFLRKEARPSECGFDGYVIELLAEMVSKHTKGAK